MPHTHDLSFYHRTDALLESFTRLAEPSRCGLRLTVDNLHDSEDVDFKLRMATFADSQARSAPGAAHVLLHFGVHGRELITSEVALRLAHILCGERPSTFAGDAERSRQLIAEMLGRVIIKMVPVQVPSARRLAEVGRGTCKQRRLNAHGVDVNRNWDVLWSAGDAGEGSSQFRGQRPFSEPETRSLARFAEEWKPDVFVEVRSGDRYMAMPYSGKAAGPSDRAHRNSMRDAMKSVNAMLTRQHPKLVRMGSLPIGPASSLGEEPYKATGTALDYMYTRVGVRRSYMFEIHGASTVYGVGGRAAREIGRLPSSVVNLLQINASSTMPEDDAAVQDANASKAVSNESARADLSSPVTRTFLPPSKAGVRHRKRGYTQFLRRQLARQITGQPIIPAHLGYSSAAEYSAGETPPASQGASSSHGPSRNLAPLAMISTAEGPPSTLAAGISAGLAAEEEPYDCVAFFNPTSSKEYEVTVNGWADALLVVINSSLSSAAMASPTDVGVPMGS